MGFEEVILTTVQIVASFITILFITFYFSRELRPFKKMGEIIDNVAGDDAAVSNISGATNSLIQIGLMAQTLNATFQDEEAFNGLIQEIAKRAATIIQMSVLGTKSGDSRRTAKAEELVNEAMISGVKKLNPIVGWVLRETGLDEELRKDPEMFQYIIKVVMDRGLLNMIDPNTMMMPKGEVDAVREAIRDFA